MEKVINARLQVKPEAIEQFIAFAQVIIGESNREKGCKIYKLYQEIGTPGSFIFYEVYENQDAVDAHNGTSHFKTFIGQITPILSESPRIVVY